MLDVVAHLCNTSTQEAETSAEPLPYGTYYVLDKEKQRFGYRLIMYNITFDHYFDCPNVVFFWL
jgi:hypothetical protein